MDFDRKAKKKKQIFESPKQKELQGNNIYSFINIRKNSKKKLARKSYLCKQDLESFFIFKRNIREEGNKYQKC